MVKLTAKLRIGEKIGLGFTLVGLLFLGVVWQYHTTYNRSLTSYQQLHHVDEAKKSHALKIANSLTAARVAEKRFLIQPDLVFVDEVGKHIDQAERLVSKMQNIDPSSALNAERMTAFIQTYHEHFKTIVEAWERKGLNHDSGLQGAFRQTVHELESIANRFNTGPLYRQLLQIRRAEQGLDSERITPLVDEFEKRLSASSLEPNVKSELFARTQAYRDAIAGTLRTTHPAEQIDRQTNGFQALADDLETLVNRYYVPGFVTSILQLRRREKDYLLRLDERYVDMALEEIRYLTERIDSSSIPAEEKSYINNLIDKYQQDFLALVAQNDRIDQLVQLMRLAVQNINALVEENVSEADQGMNQGLLDVNNAALNNERLMYLTVAAATLLAVGFAVFLTLNIVRPMRKMVGLLDQMTYEEPTERMLVDLNGRDEVNAMAISLNTMAEHKKRFMQWWRTSMAEEEACKKLKQALLSDAQGLPISSLDAAKDDLKSALLTKKGLFTTQCEGIEQLSSTITEKADELLKGKPSGDTLVALDSIRHSAQSIKNFLEIVSSHETH